MRSLVHCLRDISTLENSQKSFLDIKNIFLSLRNAKERFWTRKRLCGRPPKVDKYIHGFVEKFSRNNGLGIIALAVAVHAFQGSSEKKRIIIGSIEPGYDEYRVVRKRNF